MFIEKFDFRGIPNLDAQIGSESYFLKNKDPEPSIDNVDRKV